MNPLILMFYKTTIKRYSRDFIYLIILIFFASIFEFFSIGLLIPFLTILLNPDKFFYYLEGYDLNFIPISNFEGYFPFITTLFFIIFTIFSAISRFFLISYQTRLAFRIGTELSLDVYQNILNQPYIFHTNKNSSEITSSIALKAGSVIHGIVLPSISIVSSLIILFSILLVFFVTDSFLGLLTIVIFGLIYFLTSLISNNKLKNYGLIISSEFSHIIKLLNEGLGGIRDIILGGNQKFYFLLFKKADSKLRHAQSNVLLISSIPRYFIESFAMICIAFVAFVLSNSDSNLTSYLPTLGLIVLSSQRMLPILQQIYSGFSSIQSSSNSLVDILKFLKINESPILIEPNTTSIAKLSYFSTISFRNVSYSYPTRDIQVLSGITFEINKGDRVGLIGASGSGKSTLLDLIMSLLTPTDGFIEIDGKILDNSNSYSWRSSIAHVPQTIFLADATVAENIAFGINPLDIDLSRIRRSAELAQISSTIDSWPDGYQTYVGENGMNLSGGQKQRIGIARALYKEANVIIFDEATSALDRDTEADIIDCIHNLSSDLTLILTSHRLESLRLCNKVIELSGGKLKCIGSCSNSL